MRFYYSQLILNLQNNSSVSRIFTFVQLVKSGMQYICILQTIKDWMTVWIEWCQHSVHRLKLEFVSSLVIQAHCNGDPNVTQKEIDLAYDLRDLQVLINFVINHIFFNS